MQLIINGRSTTQTGKFVTTLTNMFFTFGPSDLIKPGLNDVEFIFCVDSMAYGKPWAVTDAPTYKVQAEAHETPTDRFLRVFLPIPAIQDGDYEWRYAPESVWGPRFLTSYLGYDLWIREHYNTRDLTFEVGIDERVIGIMPISTYAVALPAARQGFLEHQCREGDRARERLLKEFEPGVSRTRFEELG